MLELICASIAWQANFFIGQAWPLGNARPSSYCTLAVHSEGNPCKKGGLPLKKKDKQGLEEEFAQDTSSIWHNWGKGIVFLNQIKE